MTAGNLIPPSWAIFIFHPAAAADADIRQASKRTSVPSAEPSWMKLHRLPRREEIIEKISNDVKSMPEGTRTTTMELVSRYAGRDAEQLYGREGLMEMDEAFCVKAKDDILVPTGVDNDSLGQPYTIPFLVMHHHKQ